MATSTLYEAEAGWDKVDAQFEQLKADVHQAVADGWPLHQVEGRVLRRLIHLGRLLLRTFVARSGTGYTPGQPPRCAHTHAPLEYKGIERVKYRSIFGPIWLRRAAYALPQGGYVYPMDARWHRPAGQYSYLLQEWLQLNASDDDFRDAAARLNRIFGLTLVPNTPQRLTATVGAQVDDYYEQAPLPEATDGACLGLGADGKGVRILRRDRDGADVPAPEPKPRRGKGEKPNTKKESVVTGVFSFDPEPRDPDTLVRSMMKQLTEEERAERRAECRRRREEQLPQPREPLNVHARAGLDGKEAAFERAMEQLRKRDPHGVKPIIALMDGDLALEPALRQQLETAGLSDRVDAVILDIWHAAEYVWDAGTALYGEDNPKRETWVADKLRALLSSRVGRVIGGLRQTRKKRRLSAPQDRTLEKVATYFTNHRHMMDYATYLAKGYPIGNGLAEGLCNSVVADRMECSGMRWSIAGAHAMLQQRAVKQNADWDDFWAYRKHSEWDRLYRDSAYKMAA